MPSPNFVKQFAERLLSAEHIHIAGELIDTHIKKEQANPSPDFDKQQALFDLRRMYAQAKESSEPYVTVAAIPLEGETVAQFAARVMQENCGSIAQAKKAVIEIHVVAEGDGA